MGKHISLSYRTCKVTYHRPFYASLGIMTTRMLLHLQKSILQDDNLDVVVADLNWTIDQSHSKHRTFKVPLKDWR